MRSAERDGRRLHGGRGFVLLALALAQVGFLWFYARKFWFASDDFISFAVAAREPRVTWDYLRSDLFSHFNPLVRLVNWLVQHYATLSWNTVLTGMLALVLTAILLLARICDQLFGRSWKSVVLPVAFGTSIVVVALLQWWSAAVQLLPSVVLALVAISAYLSHHLDCRRWGLPVCLGAIALALLFYEKPILIPVYLLLIRVLFLQPNLAPRAVVRDLWTERRTWAAIAAVPAVYLAFYFSAGSYGVPLGLPTLEQGDHFLRVTWLRAFVPAMFGFRIPPPPTSGLEEAAVFFCQIAFFALIAVTVVRNRGAWRAWAFLLLVLAINTLLIGLPLVHIYGITVGYEMRYLTDVSFLFPIALGYAIAPPHRAPKRATVPLSKTAWGTTSAAIAAHLAVVAWTAPEMRRDWVTEQARNYVTQLRDGVARIRHSGSVPVLMDTEVPAYIMPGNHGINRMSDLTRIFDPGVRFSGARVVYQVDGDGRLRARRFVTMATADPRWPAGVSITEAGAAVTDARVTSSRERACVHAAARPVLLERVARPSRRANEWGLAVVGRARRPTRLLLFVDRGAGYPAAADRHLVLDMRRRTRRIALGGPDLLKFRIDVPPGASVCLDDVHVGRYAPAG